MLTRLRPPAVAMTDHASIFRGHVVPCKLTWDELLDLDEDTVFPTFLKGFSVTVSRFGLQLSVNGVRVLFEEVYASDNVIVHGIKRLLALPGITGEVDSVDSGLGKKRKKSFRFFFVPAVLSPPLAPTPPPAILAEGTPPLALPCAKPKKLAPLTRFPAAIDAVLVPCPSVSLAESWGSRDE